MQEVEHIQVRLVKSLIGETQRVRETVRSLGLRKLNQVVKVRNNRAMRGMLRKVSHLVKIEV
jgi:large subunit ribosomal protein L30